MRQINKIIVHGSFSRPSQDWGAQDIDRIHKEKGYDEIGYHFVIKRNGSLEPGRDMHKNGAHTLGHNHDSLGICLIGGRVEDKAEWENNYTPEQEECLYKLIDALELIFGNCEIGGHRDFDVRECPGFDIVGWYKKYNAIPIYDTSPGWLARIQNMMCKKP